MWTSLHLGQPFSISAHKTCSALGTLSLRKRVLRARDSAKAASASSGQPRRRKQSGESIKAAAEAASAATTTNGMQEGEVAGLWSMARPINIGPSYVLVLLGAFAAGGKTALTLFSVWAMAGVSAAISMASCILNDYFDFAAGTDAVDRADKPLPRGQVSAIHAVLAGGAGYIASLLAALFMPDPRLRLIVAGSAVATLLYTPLLKPIALIKNATVAMVIAAAPLAGAFAAGAAGAGLRRSLLPPCAFLFLSVLYREVLMDINDVEGDAAAGVRTLPVLLGRRAALGAGLCLLLGGMSLGLHAAWSGDGLAWAWAARPRLEALLRAASAACFAVVVAEPLAAAVRILRCDFDRETVSRAIDKTLTTIGVGLLILVALLA